MARLEDPTLDDRLGFAPYVSGIENIIRNAPPFDLPFSVGVYGPWGAGKSSFMLQLKHNLEMNNYQTLWFDAWKYDSIADVRSALIHRIFQMMSEISKNIEFDIQLAKFAQQTSNGFLKLLRHSTITLGAFGNGITIPLSSPDNTGMNQNAYFEVDPIIKTGLGQD
ncbi:MAG: P-loop NTPase fold protein [Chloroflexi bacterium]|nr:P-loop NTPase fold protein [Chloroflexota bacterium]MDA1271545.1 P-loop NTPase fold protein [Chloroflexota bacterium]